MDREKPGQSAAHLTPTLATTFHYPVAGSSPPMRTKAEKTSVLGGFINHHIPPQVVTNRRRQPCGYAYNIGIRRPVPPPLIDHCQSFRGDFGATP